jgi:hypothetical protein
LPRNKFKVGDRVPPDFVAIAPEARDTGHKDKSKAPQGKVLPNEKKPTHDKKPPRSRQQVVHIDDLFYWVCDCDTFNAAAYHVCKSCNVKRTSGTRRSKLLEIAENSVSENVTSLEEAILQVPESSRPSIPDRILAKLLESKIAGLSLSEFCTAPSTVIDAYFYWTCGSCTMQNTYRKGICCACKEAKGYFARSSPLLVVAEQIALKSKTTEEAYSKWPPLETRQIPKDVMESLITCVYIIGKKGSARRCRNQKLEGFDYCVTHCDPSLLTASRVDEYEENYTVGSDSYGKDSSPQPSSVQRRLSLIGIGSMKESLQSFLESNIGTMRNELGWAINSIEDSLLCGSATKPFPLGLKVRTYFLGYGCHDGRIMKVRRQFFEDDGSQDHRPVLMYRVIYNDGDQQDWLHHNICSMRQVFDVNNVDPEASFDAQIPRGTRFEMKSGVTVKVTRHKVSAQSEQIVSFVVDESNESSNEISLSLLKFQVAVVRRIDDQTPVASSSLEWPISNDRVQQSGNTGTIQHKVCNGLHLLNKSYKVENVAHRLQKLPNVDDPRDIRRGCKMSRWDPGNVFHYIHWDPSQCLVCEICGIDKDDSQGP